MDCGEPLQHAPVVRRVGVVVDDLAVGVAELPGGDDVLHPMVEGEERVERGRGRRRAPRLPLRGEELGGPRRARLGQAVGTRDRRDQPLDDELVEDPADSVVGERSDRIGDAVDAGEALDARCARRQRRRGVACA